jgi:hypothetical protein
MDIALNEIDNRVIQFEISKLGMDQANTMVKDMSLDPLTGILRITKLDGTVTSYDTKLEKLAINFEYDSINERLVITLDDGTKQYVDMSSLISAQNFNDSDTIAFSKENGNVSATVKSGSIKPEHIQGDYLAAITQQALNAAESAQQSHNDALVSKRFSVGGVVEGDATDNAQYYMEQAHAYADQAQMVTDITIASETKPGIVKSGTDINVDAQGNVTLKTAFEVISERANIVPGDTVTTILAKIQKYFLDIQPHAFIEKITEQYLDTLVTNKINQAIQNSAIIHNLATSNASMVLGADVGPVIAQNLSNLQSQIDTQNNNLGVLEDSLKLTVIADPNTLLTDLYGLTPILKPRVYIYENITNNAVPADYPALMVSEGAVVFPKITITRYGGISFYEIVAIKNNGMPKTIKGYYNGIFYWGTVN